jgi:hypothetical protein
VIRPLFVVQVSDPSDKRSEPLAFRPIYRFSLRFEGSQNVIGMIFDDKVLDVAALWAALGARLNVHVRHPPPSHKFSFQRQVMHAYGVLACSA